MGLVGRIAVRTAAGAAALLGVGTAVLTVVLGHPVLRGLVGDGKGPVAWLLATLVSMVFVSGVLLVLGSCFSGRGWFLPGWVLAVLYGVLLVVGFGTEQSHGRALVALVALYLTSIPFQLAYAVRSMIGKAPWGRSPMARLVVPRARPEVEALAEQVAARY